MKLHVKSASFFTDNGQTSRLSNFYGIFTLFLTIKTSSQNISITLLQIPLKLHEQWGSYWRKSYLERLFEEQFPVPRNAAASKIGNGVISLLWLIATLIITIFHLYLIQPWDSMFSSSISKQRRQGKTSARTRLINREECTFQESFGNFPTHKVSFETRSRVTSMREQLNDHY